MLYIRYEILVKIEHLSFRRVLQDRVYLFLGCADSALV